MVNAYTKGIGRLTASQEEVKGHTDGSILKHTASVIDLDTTLSFHPYWDAYAPIVTTQVQQALAALQTLIARSPTIASSSDYGLIKIAGDITGDGSSVTVSKIQNRAVSSLAPIDGQPLVWDILAHSWIPTNFNGDISGGVLGSKVIAIQNISVSSTTPTDGQILRYNSGGNLWDLETFSFGGDLLGSTFTTQSIVSLTGDSGKVEFKTDNLEFLKTVTAAIYQDKSTTVNCNDFYIYAQGTDVNDGYGGYLSLQGGDADGTNGIPGGVELKLGSIYGEIGTTTMLDVTKLDNGNRVLSLLLDKSGTIFFPIQHVTTSEMPAGTGDMVIYIKDAATAPTTGSPVGGSILYSDNGKLNIKQEDGYAFTISSPINLQNLIIPTISNSGTYEFFKKFTMLGTIAPYDDEYVTYYPANNTVIYFDVKVVAKVNGDDASTASWNMYYTYHASSSGIIGAVGTVDNTYYDTRVKSTAFVDVYPLITKATSPNRILIQIPGLFGAYEWFAVIKMVVCADD